MGLVQYGASAVLDKCNMGLARYGTSAIRGPLK